MLGGGTTRAGGVGRYAVFGGRSGAKAKKRDGDEEGEVDGGRRGKRLKI